MITFRPRANVELLTQTGTDYKIENHLQSILEFNYFPKSDFTQLKNIYETLQPTYKDELIVLFSDYFKKISTTSSPSITTSGI